MMAPDEPAHLMRAAELAHGEIVGKVVDGSAGGVIDGAIGRLWQVFVDYRKPDAPPVPNDVYEEARQVHWLNESGHADFPNTAQYGPIPYLPQALGLRLGCLFGLDLLDSYYLARGLAMVATLALGAWALALSGRIRPLGRIVLLLPMSLFLTGSSISQDGILIALGLLVAAIAGRAIDRDRPPEPGLYAAAAAAVAILAMARLPYATLAFLFLLKPMRGRGAVVAVAFIGLVVGGWLWATADLRAVAAFPAGRDVDMHRQLAWLLEDSSRPWTLAVDTLGDETYSTFYLQSIIGNLGLLTLLLAPWAYSWALYALGGGWLAGCFGARHLRPLDMLAAWLAIGLAVGGIFLGIYLTWTAVGAGRIEGVQGRYFLPLLGFLPLLVPAWPVPILRKILGAAALVAVLPVLYSMVQVLNAAYR
jgi:hypothetical protein